MFPVFLAGCGERSPQVRQYEERVIAPPPAPAMARPGGDMMAATPVATASRAGRLAWTTPEQWKESPGSGMRLASFAVGSGSVPAECTITSFPGDVGGREANLRRWLGQLSLNPAPEEFARFAASAEPFTTAGGYAGEWFDFATLSGAGATSMLAAIIQLEGAQAFVKLTGPVAVLQAEREKFISLSKSLR